MIYRALCCLLLLVLVACQEVSSPQGRKTDSDLTTDDPFSDSIVLIGNKTDSSLNQLPFVWTHGTWRGLIRSQVYDKAGGANGLASYRSSWVVVGYKIANSASGENGTKNPDLRAAGFWQYGFWSKLTIPDFVGASEATCVTAVADDLYIGGYYYDETGRKHLGYWKNLAWTELDQTSTKENNDFVRSILALGEDLYFLGWAGSSGEKNGSYSSVSGFWKNTTPMIAVNTIDEPTLVEQIAFSDGSTDVLCLGSATTASAGYWKNAEWFPLSGLVADSNPHVTSISVIDKKILAIGVSQEANHVLVPVLWTDGVISQLPGSSSLQTGSAEIVVSKSGQVVVAGSYTQGNTNYPVIWINGVLEPAPSAGSGIVISGIDWN